MAFNLFYLRIQQIILQCYQREHKWMDKWQNVNVIVPYLKVSVFALSGSVSTVIN